MARVWFRSNRAGDVFQELFRTDAELGERGTILGRERAGELHIPPPGGRYGDLVWIAHPGVLVFPDFFHYRKICRGMHGYETHIPEQQGFALVLGSNIEQTELPEAELIDVCPALCRLMGIRAPKQNAGKSFV